MRAVFWSCVAVVVVGLGYVIAKRRGAELTKAGTRRRTMLYVLVSRPEGRTQGNLFDEVTR